MLDLLLCQMANWTNQARKDHIYVTWWSQQKNPSITMHHCSMFKTVTKIVSVWLAVKKDNSTKCGWYNIYKKSFCSHFLFGIILLQIRGGKPFLMFKNYLWITSPSIKKHIVGVGAKPNIMGGLGTTQPWSRPSSTPKVKKSWWI